VDQIKTYTPIVVAVLIGIILQGILVLADGKATPGAAAVEFARAFYRVDPEMSSLLCSKNLEMDEGRVVEAYIQGVKQEAADRGFGQDNLKYTLYHIETHTRMVDDGTAEVKLTATRRVSINPVYALVAKIFLIGETYQVNELLTVIKEDGGWKVCGNPFSFMKT